MGNSQASMRDLSTLNTARPAPPSMGAEQLLKRNASRLDWGASTADVNDPAHVGMVLRSPNASAASLRFGDSPVSQRQYGSMASFGDSPRSLHPPAPPPLPPGGSMPHLSSGAADRAPSPTVWDGPVPSMGRRLVHEGWLWKQARKSGGKNWRKRWFTLVGSARAGFMFAYFKNAGTIHPDDAHGVIYLDPESLVTTLPTNFLGRKHRVIRVTGVAGQIIHVHGNDQAEQDGWLAALEKCVGLTREFHGTVAEQDEAMAGLDNLASSEQNLQNMLRQTRAALRAQEERGRQLQSDYDSRAKVVKQMQRGLQKEIDSLRRRLVKSKRAEQYNMKQAAVAAAKAKAAERQIRGTAASIIGDGTPSALRQRVDELEAELEMARKQADENAAAAAQGGSGGGGGGFVGLTMAEKTKYKKMLKVLPISVVEHKMRTDGLDPRLLDEPALEEQQAAAGVGVGVDVQGGGVGGGGGRGRSGTSPATQAEILRLRRENARISALLSAFQESTGGEGTGSQSQLLNVLAQVQHDGYIEPDEDLAAIEQSFRAEFSQPDLQTMLNGDFYKQLLIRNLMRPAYIRNVLETLQQVFVKYQIRSSQLSNAYWRRQLSQPSWGTQEDRWCPPAMLEWAKVEPWLVDDEQRMFCNSTRMHGGLPKDGSESRIIGPKPKPVPPPPPEKVLAERCNAAETKLSRLEALNVAQRAHLRTLAMQSFDLQDQGRDTSKADAALRRCGIISRSGELLSQEEHGTRHGKHLQRSYSLDGAPTSRGQGDLFRSGTVANKKGNGGAIADALQAPRPSGGPSFLSDISGGLGKKKKKKKRKKKTRGGAGKTRSAPPPRPTSKASDSFGSGGGKGLRTDATQLGQAFGGIPDTIPELSPNVRGAAARSRVRTTSSAAGAGAGLGVLEF